MGDNTASWRLLHFWLLCAINETKYVTAKNTVYKIISVSNNLRKRCKRVTPCFFTIQELEKGRPSSLAQAELQGRLRVWLGRPAPSLLQPCSGFNIAPVVKYVLVENPCVRFIFFLNPCPFFYFCYTSSLIAFRILILSVLQCIHLSTSWANPKISVHTRNSKWGFCVLTVLVLCFFLEASFQQPLV